MRKRRNLDSSVSLPSIFLCSRPPPDPLPGSLPERRGPRPNGPTGQEMGQVISQAIGAAIAAQRILVQTFQTDRFQVARHLGGKSTRRRRLPADYLLQRIPD